MATDKSDAANESILIPLRIGRRTRCLSDEGQHGSGEEEEEGEGEEEVQIAQTKGKTDVVNYISG